MIYKIITKYKDLFKDNPTIEKINVGFTNTIYSINNLYIVKICTDINNEKNFINEINFYNTNQDNTYIPKLYYSDISKETIPYFYEIIEKIEGVSLYNIWYNLDEEKREDIIKQLCDIMKTIHSNHTNKYDWVSKIKEDFNTRYSKVKELNTFTSEEITSIDKAYNKFDKYLESNDFVLVHNDLHFDNIFYYEGKIKIIDFERSISAPKDFELDILYRMIRKPWKFASEETEEYTKLEDYSNIMEYIKKYYPELVNIDYLYERLSIYDIVYYLKHLIKYPHLNELKEDILNAIEIVNRGE